ANLVFAITPYAHVLENADFTIGGASWTAPADYGYASGVLAIQETFLETLSAGDYVVSVESVALFTIHVKNPTGPQVVPGSKTTILEHATIAADLSIWTSLYGREGETVVSIGGIDLATEAYTVSIERIILRQAYLESLSYGTYVFTIQNTHGADTFTVLVSDRPTANEGSQNVTKYTYETITQEPFRVTAVPAWGLSHFLFAGGVSYYNYLIEPISEPEPEAANVALDQKSIYGAFGTITIDDATGSFSFDRAPGWWGIIIFDYQAFDTAGLSSVFILMDIVYLETPAIIADATDKTFTSGGVSLRWPITNSSGNAEFPIWKIQSATEDLTLDVDYTVGPREGSILYFDLTAAYLETLALGVHSFTLWTEGGNAEFQLTVLGAPASTDTTATFDLANPADVSFLLTGYPLVSATITRSAVPLAPAYYTFADGLLIIKAGFLSVQGYGDVVIRVANATGSVD
ncbi:MAG: hypothetical protein Q8N15_04225, partial [Bacillota bacterium]|nr:hypothetical protein [Bacillota bacterium]